MENLWRLRTLLYISERSLRFWTQEKLEISESSWRRWDTTFLYGKKLWKGCVIRLRLILKSGLNARNRIDAINSLALPLVTYSFTVTNWSLTEIKKVDTKRLTLKMRQMHHPKYDPISLNFLSKEWVRGLVQLEISLKTQIIGMDTYLNNQNHWMLQRVKNTRKITYILCY